MKYQKIINLLDDTTNQSFKFRKRNWVKVNDESRRRYDDSNIRFKTSMIRSTFCNYSHAYILVKGTITVPNMAATGGTVNNTNKKVILKINSNKKVVFKIRPPFTDWITKVDNKLK